jgi:hypothetical protein
MEKSKVKKEEERRGVDTEKWKRKLEPFVEMKKEYTTMKQSNLFKKNHSIVCKEWLVTTKHTSSLGFREGKEKDRQNNGRES